jgi:hypothetical protein
MGGCASRQRSRAPRAMMGRSETAAEQLQAGLNSRVTIEAGLARDFVSSAAADFPPPARR